MLRINQNNIIQKNDQDDFTGIIELSIERYNQYKSVKDIAITDYDLYAWVKAIDFVEKQIQKYNQVNDQDSNIGSILKNIFFPEKEQDIKIKAILKSLHQKYLQSENSVNFYDWYEICPIINQVDTAIELDQSEIVNNRTDNDGLSDKIALDNQVESGVVTDL